MEIVFLIDFFSLVLGMFNVRSVNPWCSSHNKRQQTLSFNPDWLRLMNTLLRRRRFLGVGGRVRRHDARLCRARARAVRQRQLRRVHALLRRRGRRGRRALLQSPRH